MQASVLKDRLSEATFAGLRPVERGMLDESWISELMARRPGLLIQHSRKLQWPMLDSKQGAHVQSLRIVPSSLNHRPVSLSGSSAGSGSACAAGKPLVKARLCAPTAAQGAALHVARPFLSNAGMRPAMM